MKLFRFLFFAILVFIVSCAEMPTGKVNPAWPDEAQSAVRNHNIAIGMTQEQVVASWGRLWETTKSVSPNGLIEIWKYGLG